MAQSWSWEDLVTVYGGHKAGYVSSQVDASMDVKVRSIKNRLLLKVGLADDGPCAISASGRPVARMLRRTKFDSLPLPPGTYIASSS